MKGLLSTGPILSSLINIIINVQHTQRFNNQFSYLTLTSHMSGHNPLDPTLNQIVLVDEVAIQIIIRFVTTKNL